jgi:hypothetical protein
MESSDGAPEAGSAEEGCWAVRGEEADSLAGASGTGTSVGGGACVVMAVPIRGMGVRSFAANKVSSLRWEETHGERLLLLAGAFGVRGVLTLSWVSGALGVSASWAVPVTGRGVELSTFGAGEVVVALSRASRASDVSAPRPGGARPFPPVSGASDASISIDDRTCITGAAPATVAGAAPHLPLRVPLLDKPRCKRRINPSDGTSLLRVGERTSSPTGTGTGRVAENSTCSVWMPASTIGTGVRGEDAEYMSSSGLGVRAVTLVGAGPWLVKGS